MDAPRRLVATLVVLAIVGVACTSGGSTPTSEPLPSPPEPGPAVPGWASELPGRLLIRGTDGSLATVRPDGSDGRVLVAARGQELRVIQAAWAPDGSRVAWSQVDAREGALQARLVTATATGEDVVETPMPVVPFYLSWDPTSSRVGYLGAEDPERLVMGVVDGASAPSRVRYLARGSPLYFSWGPDGDRLLVHLGDDRLAELDLNGRLASLGAAPGLFQAPVWSGGLQLWAERIGRRERQRIVGRDVASDERRVLATVDGAASIVASPSGDRLALQGLNTGERDLFDRSVATRATDVGVTIVDVATGRAERVTTRPAVAFSWSPGGERLAILEPVYRVTGPIRFRWVIWDGSDTIETEPFIAGIALLTEIVPFFNQYAQSASMWSPDGRAFAYPVDAPPLGTTIWIQPVDGSPPFRLGPGAFVAWAPSA